MDTVSFAQGFLGVGQHPDRRDGREGGGPHSDFVQVSGRREVAGRRECQDSEE